MADWVDNRVTSDWADKAITIAVLYGKEKGGAYLRKHCIPIARVEQIRDYMAYQFDGLFVRGAISALTDVLVRTDAEMTECYPKRGKPLPTEATKTHVTFSEVRKRLDMGDHQSGCRYLNGGPCDCHWTDVMEGRTPYDDD